MRSRVASVRPRGSRERAAGIIGWVLLLVLVTAAAGYADDPGAAPSGITGVVVSAETGEPVAFADVVMFQIDEAGAENALGGVLTKGDGTFRRELPPGSYKLIVSHVSYDKLEVTDVVVEGVLATLDIPLTPRAARTKVVKVSADALRNTDVAILSRQKKAAAVSDGVSAEFIKKTPDANAAEVLHRVTGLSVVDDKYVFVRGLGERYSATKVNGSAISSPEANKRVVPLDLFPSGLLDNVVVQKTQTPDQPGDFGGGVVDVRTRDFPGHRVIEFSLGSGANTNTTGKDFQTYAGGHRDWLGFDDGTRDIPDLVHELAGDSAVRLGGAFTPGGFSKDQITAMGRSFNKTYDPKTKSGRPPVSFNGSYGDEFRLFGRSLGFIASTTVNNSSRAYDFRERFFADANDEGGLETLTDFRGRTSRSSTLWGSLVNASYRLGAAHTLRLETVYNRSSEDEVRAYEGENNNTGIPMRDTRFLYVERGVFQGSLKGEHVIRPLLGARVDWNYNYSQSERNEPDRREYIYEKYDVIGRDSLGDPYVAAQEWRMSTRSVTYGVSRTYTYMDDIERQADLNVTVPFRQWNGLESRFKAGVLDLNKDRDLNTRRFVYRTPKGNASLDLTRSPEELLIDENIGASNTTFRLDEITQGSDAYRAAQDIRARYAMIDMPLYRKVRLVSGVRWEDSEQKVFTISNFNPDAELITSELNTKDALPSANLSYSFHPDANLRLAYSKSLNRPDIRELSPQVWDDFQSEFAITGNPELQRAILHNYDMRVEYYPGLNEMLALSLFKKDLIHPIEYTIIGGEQPIFRPENSEADGRLSGMEFESRVNLGRVSRSLRPWGVSTNVTLVDSKVKVDKIYEGISERPLQGQSKYVVNLGLFYTARGGRTGASILYNVFGRRLKRVGVGDVPDVYEEPRHGLDATLSHAFGSTRLKAAIQNILNEDDLYEAAGEITSLQERGRTFALSLSYAM